MIIELWKATSVKPKTLKEKKEELINKLHRR
jgi:hypothetical protein